MGFGGDDKPSAGSASLANAAPLVTMAIMLGSVTQLVVFPF